ncbi:hypothetical protein [Rahnella contaminans]|uniref:hypothetical protein n=1 Tax=Rahnella contaminans TaxID=2703882 RepID=UPI0023D9D280|nr:hypothetical protein [Rahnella contaminans]MDF1896680.1 hypothetical protein [Rahnella contaminans]
MINYSDNIGLRVDVAALANATYELREQFRAFEKKYFWGSDELTQRLAGQVVNQLSGQMLEIHKQVNELDHAFRD